MWLRCGRAVVVHELTGMMQLLSVIDSCVILLLFTGAAEAGLLLPHATPDRTLFERLHDPRLVPTSEAQAMPVVRLPGHLLHLPRWLQLPHLLHHILACCTY